MIQGLVEQYYNTSEVIRDIFIFKKRGEQIINVFPNLAANKWGLWKYGSTDIPDLEKQDALLDQVRLRLARQIYQLAVKSLELKGRKDEWNRKYGKHHLNRESHEELVDYSVGAFFWLEILTPYEYDTSEPQIDEHGILLGMKKLPKHQPDGLMKELEQFVGKSEEPEDE